MNVATCVQPRTATAVAVVHGTVVTGDQRGRLLGFPTANLVLSDVSDLRDGVYMGVVHVESGEQFAAAISVGRRPTFYAERGMRLLEAHLLDFDGELYGQQVTVDLDEQLRDQERFEAVTDLIAQLTRDVAEVRSRRARRDPAEF